MRKPSSLSAAQVRKWLPRRPEDAHKGLNGHVLVLAGSRGMSGAAALCARGALRIGAGLVTAAIVEGERQVVARQLSEVMTLGLPETWEGVMTENALPILKEFSEKRQLNAMAVGPGLSVDAAVARVVKALVKTWDLPLVLDADGLNNVSLENLRGRAKLVITPHVGELARLMRVDTDMIKRDPMGAAHRVAKEYQLICVLKGHPTMISDGTRMVSNPTGNPAMATGGMGDVLTGVIAGLIAQNLAPWDAACAGVYLHGLAGDMIRTSDRGLLASDVADALPRALSKIGVK